jgi:hypothetical protein
MAVLSQADVLHAMVVRPAESWVSPALLLAELGRALLWAVFAARRYSGE